MSTGDIEVVHVGLWWYIRTQGTGLEHGRYRLKITAVENARSISRDLGAELIIKRLDGRIGSRDSYGNDPRQSKG